MNYGLFAWRGNRRRGEWIEKQILSMYGHMYAQERRRERSRRERTKSSSSSSSSTGDGSAHNVCVLINEIDDELMLISVRWTLLSRAVACSLPCSLRMRAHRSWRVRRARDKIDDKSSLFYFFIFSTSLSLSNWTGTDIAWPADHKSSVLRVSVHR